MWWSCNSLTTTMGHTALLQLAVKKAHYEKEFCCTWKNSMAFLEEVMQMKRSPGQSLRQINTITNQVIFQPNRTCSSPKKNSNIWFSGIWAQHTKTKHSSWLLEWSR
jgi:hypothetical protein